MSDLVVLLNLQRDRIMYSRRLFVTSALLATLTYATANRADAKDEAAEPPNVVVIFMDDMG